MGNNVFSCRAECVRDIDEFVKEALATGVSVEEMSRETKHPLPDVSWEFSSDASMDVLLSTMERVEDTHVMRETLQECPLSKNDLRRRPKPRSPFRMT